jgi:hypothetical protein
MNEPDTYVYIYIYINSILIDDGDTKGSPRNALIVCHHVYVYVCHFIISSPCLQKKMSRLETRETKIRLYVYGCMYVCLWPIGIVYMHVVHTNINGISLCYRHNRPTKNRRIRRKGRESTSFFIYRQTPIEAKKGEKENICQIYAPLCSCSVYWRWYQMLPMLPPLLAAVYEQIEAWVP